MLSDYDLHPTLATSDVSRAKGWYAEKMGWQPTKELEGYARYELGPSGFAVYESPSAGTAQNTVMFWLVDSVTAEVRRLRDRGVTFVEYDLGDIKTVSVQMTDTGRHPA